MIRYVPPRIGDRRPGMLQLIRRYCSAHRNWPRTRSRHESCQVGVHRRSTAGTIRRPSIVCWMDYHVSSQKTGVAAVVNAYTFSRRAQSPTQRSALKLRQYASRTRGEFRMLSRTYYDVGAEEVREPPADKSDQYLAIGIECLRNGGSGKNVLEAHYWLLRAAKMGNMEAQYQIGMLYEQDPPEISEADASSPSEGPTKKDKAKEEVQRETGTQGEQVKAPSPEAQRVLQELETIKKRARKERKQFLKEQRERKRRMQQSEDASNRQAEVVVTRATAKDLSQSATWMSPSLSPEDPVDPEKLGIQQGSEAELAVSFNGVLESDADLHEINEENLFDLAWKKDTKLAAMWMKTAALNGHRSAQVHMGNLCLREAQNEKSEISGSGGKTETSCVSTFAADGAREPQRFNTHYKHAWTWYQRAGEEPQPNPDALFNLGQMLEQGVGVVQNRPASLVYFKRAAELGDSAACFWLGHIHRVGDSELQIQPEREKALSLLEKAAQLGNGEAMHYLSQLFRGGDEDIGIAPDSQQFWHWLDEAERAGSPSALYTLGTIYFEGSEGKKRSFARAAQYFSSAGRAGNADALCALGTCYYHGLGVREDLQKAFSLYQEAADLHCLEAWKNIASMYLEGKGVPKNETAAEHIIAMLEQLASDSHREM